MSLVILSFSGLEGTLLSIQIDSVLSKESALGVNTNRYSVMAQFRNVSIKLTGTTVGPQIQMSRPRYRRMALLSLLSITEEGTTNPEGPS